MNFAYNPGAARRIRPRRLATCAAALAMVCTMTVEAGALPARPTWLPATVDSELAALVALAVALAIALAGMLIRARALGKLNTELRRTRDLAAHREHERDLAQQELMRKLEEERELAKEKMQFEAQLSEYEKFASLAQLALGAAHEINNPLLGILSHLELELNEAIDGEQRAEIEQCIEGAKRISFAVRGLLNYARPGPLLISKINLDRLVAETLNFVAHQPMFRGIAMLKNIPQDLPAISADANQISQVIMNLLLNAAQATTGGGKISITAEKVKFDDAVEIVVADTGCGIPADILPHVFEPFFTTKRGKGTGLGLSISQAYIRSHGGDIRVDSIPGRGTTVRMRLPIRQEGRPMPESEEVVA
ncbi:MAG TPA: ATP-binding protein [Clostridia bacterium]|nr:ATP-binding protein [Clostridia bacterium]